MSHKYSFEDLSSIMESNVDGPFIIQMTNDDVYVGYLHYVKDSHGWRAIEFKPLGIRVGCPMFIRRMDIRHIIGFNGHVYPKHDDLRRHCMLDIFQLSDLINKAGYEFV